VNEEASLDEASSLKMSIAQHINTGHPLRSINRLIR
jgi:hypothetical protein